MRRLTGLLLLMAVLALACSGDDDEPEALPAPVEAARQHLAGRLGVSAAAIEVVSFEQRDWPDRCLGLSIPNVLCAQVITPGYRAVLRIQGREHGYRTDLGTTVLPEEGAGIVTP